MGIPICRKCIKDKIPEELQSSINMENKFALMTDCSLCGKVDMNINIPYCRYEEKENRLDVVLRYLKEQEG
jgi:hypothetical protein